MAGKATTDKFANMAILSVTESAANTLTFKKLETGISLSEKVAWIIHQIEYNIASMSETMFNTNLDSLAYGLAVSSTFAAPVITETTILDINFFQRIDYTSATPAQTTLMNRQPFIKDFTNLPNGGIIVPPVPIYAFAQGTGLANANGFSARIYYSILQLATEDYWELVEARRVLSS